MISSIGSSAPVSHPHHAPAPKPAPKPQPPAQKQDSVVLSSAAKKVSGDVDHDGH
jgi:hypothetical protein